MNESRRVEMLNQIMDTFSEQVVGLNNALFDASQDLDIELDHVEKEVQVPYKEPENFDKFKKKYKQEFFEEQYRADKEGMYARLFDVADIRDRKEAVQRAALMGVTELIAENAREMDRMRSFRARLQAELDDLRSELEYRKVRYSEILHDDSLSVEERNNQIQALREGGLRERMAELQNEINEIDTFTTTYDKLATLDVDSSYDIENIPEVLFEAAETLGNSAAERQAKYATGTRVENVDPIAVAAEPEAPQPEPIEMPAPEEPTPIGTSNDGTNTNPVETTEEVEPEMPVPTSGIDSMTEAEIRAEMAGILFGPVPDALEKLEEAEKRFEEANPGMDFIANVDVNDIQWQMDDNERDRFNELRDGLAAARERDRARAEQEKIDKINAIRKEMAGILFGPVPDALDKLVEAEKRFEEANPGMNFIANVDVNDIQWQMDDNERDRFNELRAEYLGLIDGLDINEIGKGTGEPEPTPETPVPPIPPVPPVDDDTTELDDPSKGDEEPSKDDEEPSKGDEEPSNEPQGYTPVYSTKAPGMNYNEKNTAREEARQVIRSRKSGLKLGLGVVGVGTLAAVGVFGAPVASAAVAASLIVGGVTIGDNVVRKIKEKATTHKLRKFAKKIDKDMQVAFDYNTGHVDLVVEKDGKLVPISGSEELYQIAKSNGLTRADVDYALKKATRDGALIRMSYDEYNEGLSTDIFDRDDGVSGLEQLYDQAGGLKIKAPVQDREENAKAISKITKAGLGKLKANIEKLQGYIDNAQKYNLSDEQESLIQESINYQQGIINRSGLRKDHALGTHKVEIARKATGEFIGGALEHLPIFGQNIRDARDARKQREAEKAAEAAAKRETEQVVETPVVEAPVEAAPGAEAPVAPTQDQQVQETLETTEQELSQEVSQMLSEEAVAQQAQMNGVLDDDDLSEEAPAQGFEPLSETAEHVEAPAQTDSSLIGDRERFIEQLRGCSEPMLDTVVEAMRDSGKISEEEITALLQAAGRLPEQSNDKGMGM